MDIDLDRISFEIDWPIIARIKDDLFPYEGYDHVRYTARALLENQNGDFGFLHIVGEDFFGVRDHLETCGGGLEENEDLVTCMMREVKEETGMTVKKMRLVGSVVDSYNKIHRITLSTFFHCLVDDREISDMKRTEEEQILIKELVWLKPEEALDRLKNGWTSDVDLIVQRRDAAALEYYLENKDKTSE
ncbi:MAG: NUDIX domain-containing protein [Erysipelotrichaceae bacterium]|nr:NUDIX domain-containing protein [Erysipelotrichaceae bacterium]